MVMKYAAYMEMIMIDYKICCQTMDLVVVHFYAYDYKLFLLYSAQKKVFQCLLLEENRPYFHLH